MAEKEGAANTKIAAKEIFAKAVDAYTASVYRHAFFYLHNHHDAEDICQETFLKLYTEKSAFSDEEHIKAWLLRVCSNLCKNLLRRKKHTDTLPLEEALAVSGESGWDETLALVFSLPPVYSAALYLYYYEGYRTAEIASLLGEKDATVRSHLKRGRELLKKLIGGEENEEFR